MAAIEPALAASAPAMPQSLSKRSRTMTAKAAASPARTLQLSPLQTPELATMPACGLAAVDTGGAPWQVSLILQYADE
jgi:hypothetical protein